jgi:aspartate aminotransferase
MPVTFSTFASTVQGETAFTVLAAARRLLAAGKDVIELEIGDSPFPTSPAGRQSCRSTTRRRWAKARRRSSRCG